MSSSPSSALRYVIGAMTGTSIDGIDAALVAIEGAGLGMRAQLVTHAARAFPAALATRLRGAAEQAPMSAGAFAALALELGEFHAEVLSDLATGRSIDLVAAHGQTVFHAPPHSWQLLNPAPIVARLNCPVVCDLRQADLAVGGEGAPITPLADWVLCADEQDRAIVNLGGFCNATILPAGCVPDAVRGFDVCACNQVLDAVAREALGQPFDVDGATALRGRSDSRAEHELFGILAAQGAARRSLGTGDEAQGWVKSHRARLSGADLAASAAAAVGGTIGRALAAAGLGSASEILLAGGGARNAALTAAIAANSPGAVRGLDAIGIAIDAREAMEMAVLGALAADGVAISLSAVTHRGATALRDGAWWFPSAGASASGMRHSSDLHAALASNVGRPLR